MADRRSIRLAQGLTAVVLLLFCAGCVRGCRSSRPPIHLNPNMDSQPKYQAQAASSFFHDGMTMRQPIPGTIARGELPGDPVYETGKLADGTAVAEIPLQVDGELLARGEQRYGIYCAPCHDKRGTGKGVLFERGNVPTTSMHDPKVLEATDGHVFDVISNGQGLMSGYRYPISVADRWAIVAWVRELQRRHEN